LAAGLRRGRLRGLEGGGNRPKADYDNSCRMTIENSSTIDAIGTDKVTGVVHLSIFNHLRWEREALYLLQQKINSYLGFIESGELVEAYPSAGGQQVAIEVFCKFRPTDEAVTFFEKAEAVAREYSAALRYTHAGDGYADDSA